MRAEVVHAAAARAALARRRAVAAHDGAHEFERSRAGHASPACDADPAFDGVAGDHDLAQRETPVVEYAAAERVRALADVAAGEREAADGDVALGADREQPERMLGVGGARDPQALGAGAAHGERGVEVRQL